MESVEGAVGNRELPSTVRRWVRGLDVAAAIAVGAAVLAWILDPLEVRVGPAHLTVGRGLKPTLIAALLIVLRALVAWRGPRFGRDVVRVLRSPWFLRPLLALGSVIAFFSVFEWILAAVGFQAELPPIVIRGEQPDTGPHTHFMRPDPELRWRLNPGAEFNGRFVNQMGFFDREVEPQKPPGTRRVICMGDSCTAQGIPPYSGFLHERLQQNPPTPEPWESFNMAVHGYSTTQGLRLFRTRTRFLQPDVVTLYYGWNDHWLSRQPDRTLLGIRMNSWTAYWFEKLRHRRFFQFMIHALNPVRQIARTREGFTLRVPPAEYERNLQALIREIRALGAQPIVMTAPRDRHLTPLLIKNNQAKDLGEVIRLHDQYVDLTRQAAADAGVPLLDLAAAFSDPAEAELLFSNDGIHLTREGRIRIAAYLHDMLHAMADEGAWAR